MEVHFAPEIETRLSELSASTGRPAHEFVADAMETYLEDLVEVHRVLDERYHEIVSGEVAPIDGEAFFASLLEREQTMLRQRAQS